MSLMTVRITGTTPLLMHNAQLSMPTNKYAKAMKEISGKRKKTSRDLEELALLEFHGGLYLNKDGEPALPREMLYGCLLRGARKSKNGKLIEAGVTFDKAYYQLEYEGPRTASELWELEDKDGDKPFVDQRMVSIQRSKIMRTRPFFETWAVEVTLHVEPAVLDEPIVKEAWQNAGTYARLGDGRVLGFGSFKIE